MHRRRHAQLRGRLQHRVAHIAAGADGDVGLELADDALRLRRGGQDVFQRGKVVLYICGLEAAVQISYADGFHLVAGARDEVRLHAPLRADEQELRIRRGHGYAPGNGYQRGRAAGFA